MKSKSPNALLRSCRRVKLSGTLRFQVSGAGSRRVAAEVMYKFTYAGRQVWHSIGLHGAPWTPDQAREEAKRLAGKVASGENPARARAERRRLLSLQDLAERFMAEHVATKDKASTAREYQRLFDRIVIPRLGRHRIDTVSRVDVAQLHHDLSPTPYQANRVPVSDIKDDELGRETRYATRWRQSMQAHRKVPRAPA